MPQYVNHERGGHTDKPRREATVGRSPRSEGDGRRGAEGIPPAAAGAPPFAELSPRAGGQRRRRGRVRSNRQVRPRGAPAADRMVTRRSKIKGSMHNPVRQCRTEKMKQKRQEDHTFSRRMAWGSDIRPRRAAEC